MTDAKSRKHSERLAATRRSQRDKREPIAFDAKLVARIHALVGDMEVDLDGRLDPEDE